MDFEKYYSDRQKLINNFLEKRMQKKAFPAWMKHGIQPFCRRQAHTPDSFNGYCRCRWCKWL